MKTPSPALAALASVAITAAILAPASTSGSNDETHISRLEGQVSAMKADIRVLIEDAEQTHHWLSCYSHTTPVTAYKAADGKLWLAPMRRAGQRHLFVALVAPSCMPRLTQSQLGWKY